MEKSLSIFDSGFCSMLTQKSRFSIIYMYIYVYIRENSAKGVTQNDN